MGYHQAGFEVVGVDIAPQPHYPFAVFELDAREVVPMALERDGYVAIHASPPCQFATDYGRNGRVGESPNLIPAARALLEASGLPYVIENVERARPYLVDPITICGSQFDPAMDIRRHRLFEANWPLEPPIWPCRHKLQAPDRFPGGGSVRDRGHTAALVRKTVEIGTWDIPLEVQAQAMGIDWMTVEELSEAIPPAYTEFIGAQLLARIALQAV